LANHVCGCTPIPAFAAFCQGGIVSDSVAVTAADGYQAGNLDGSAAKLAVVDLVVVMRVIKGETLLP
jgi:hypothetical protein